MHYAHEQPDPEAEYEASPTISIPVQPALVARQMPKAEPRDRQHAA
jgi:hypothetical protein